MLLKFRDRKLGSIFNLVIKENEFNRDFIRDQKESVLTIAWNTGPNQKIKIDEIRYDFPSQSLLPLVVNNNFLFEDSSTIIAWQFNREFYCIVDHDEEVSCSGFIFYGSQDQLFIQLEEKFQHKLQALLAVFMDEFEEKDKIQGEMLRMLLKRLIIIMTRLGKKQYISPELVEKEIDIIRDFNLLVENHFRTYHQVQDYAALLNKSPKTLSNLFLKFDSKSPLQIIRARIILEAKRLLNYTDKSTKEIAFELGFDEPSSFSRLFKKETGQAPTFFKQQLIK